MKLGDLRQLVASLDFFTDEVEVQVWDYKVTHMLFDEFVVGWDDGSPTVYLESAGSDPRKQPDVIQSGRSDTEG